jgi:uncharacterized membrane protein
MKRTNFLKDEWPQILILFVPFVFLAAFWDQLPERMVTHWGWKGQPNGYTSKGIGFFIIPIINVGVAALLLWLNRIDPKANKMKLPDGAIKPFRLVITGFLSAITCVIILPALGMDFNPSDIVTMGMPLVFLAMGNYLPTLQPNYFAGIRTPWSLESPENWRLTHQFSGKLWVTASALFFVIQFFLSDTLRPICFGIYLAAIILPPFIYSYMLFQRSKRGVI